MTDPPRLSLRAMAAFAATVEQGSIAGAARALNIAASAVAASVDQVEAEVGAALLVRTRAKGIAPTEEGRMLAARFRA
ncbi:LysR family transcriptional regulator, partial [Nioella sp.]